MTSPARAAFASDASLCSYNTAAAAAQDREEFRENRMGRQLVNIYEQDCYSKESVISAVGNCMKKHADNLLQSLDGINARLSQLEIYCYKLERSIGELRSERMDDRSDADLKFESLEKHLREVHRSVQILHDKQELAETEKELASLQLIQKGTIQKNEEGVPSSMLEAKENDDKPQVPKQELALVPLHQANAIQPLPLQFQPYNRITVQQLVPVSLSKQEDQQKLNQGTLYYLQSENPAQEVQNQSSQPTVHYVRQPVQNPHTQVLVQQPQQTSQAPQSHPHPQQQWPKQPSQQFQPQVQQSQPQVVQLQQPNTQQLSPQVVQPQASSSLAQTRPQAPTSYPQCFPHQPANPNPGVFSSMVMQSPYSTISLPQQNHQEGMSPVYVSQVSTMPLPSAEHHMQQQQQQPPLYHGSFGPQLSKVGDPSAAPYPIQGNAQSYNTASYRYPPSSSVPAVSVMSQQPPAGGSAAYHHLGPENMHNHPFGEMVEKAVRMGHPRDLVEGMALRMASTGQPIDFNSLLDRLNGGGTAATTLRAWSG